MSSLRMGSTDCEIMLRIRGEGCLHEITKDHQVVKLHPLQPFQVNRGQLLQLKKKARMFNNAGLSSAVCNHMDFMPSYMPTGILGISTV